ncbi:TIGR01459 family HAD-type hydrolase [Methylocapsa sp. S129]|uniref:TIGR01459 family HAD-type hydrolase n=1 Tax=Methylocapsa sp. S129 TaxID=1641869 RepID=UPI00131D2EB3|nr:TIGR01459 family HAD-type hydrolase [Methylocapsa sp. S129]
MRKPSLFSACSAAFNFIFIDQYGVLHDGQRSYPGAVDALSELKARGTRVVILSNSGRSGEANARRMERLGFARDLYDHFLTSGDVAKAALLDGELPAKPGPATRCLTISSSSEHDLADALGFTIAHDGAQADLVIISGSQGDRVSLDAYERQIAPAARRQTPCLCTNPDKLMLTSEGTHPGAGAIAALYEQRGGVVRWIGKPYPEIYAVAARLVGSPAPNEVLCIGDSIEHDIVGAHRFGAAAALVRTGILADLSESELAIECAKHGVAPDVILRGFA